MPRYRVLQQFDARHETFTVGQETDFAQWRAVNTRIGADPRHDIPGTPLPADAHPAVDAARLEDIAAFVARGLIEDLDRDELPQGIPDDGGPAAPGVSAEPVEPGHAEDDAPRF